MQNKNIKTERNTLYVCGLEERPVYEQTLLMHLDNLLCYMQYDVLTNEERHHVYHVAIALISLFANNGISIPRHYLEWIAEASLDFIEGGK